MLATICELDRVAPGLAGHYLRASDERRQVIAAFLSTLPFGDRRSVALPDGCSQKAKIASLLQDGSHLEILRAAFDAVPVGFRGALRRTGSFAQSPRYYKLLHHLLGSKRRARIAELIRHLEEVDLDRLIVACILPAEMLHPGLVSRVENGAEARDMVSAIRLLRSAALDKEAFFQGLSVLRKRGNVRSYLANWLLRCRFAPSPIAANSKYRPVEDGETLVRKALQYRNCSRDYALDLLEGTRSLAEFMVPDGNVLIMLIQRNGEWLLEDVYAAQNRDVDHDIRRQAVDYCRMHGVAERGRSQRRETKYSGLRRLVPRGGWV